VGNGRARRLLRNLEGVAYWGAAAPVLALLPAALGYRIACWRGDCLSRWQDRKRAELARNLRLVLGTGLSRGEVQQVTREWFRLASCEAIDVMRLRHSALALRRLVEIRGREHLENAMAAGNGAIVCSGHFGSFDSAFSMLGACGFPVTTIGRWQHEYTVNISSAERRFWDLVYARRFRRHRRRPNIEPWPGRFEVAVRAAAVVRANEVLTVAIDAPPLDSDRARAVDVHFLGRRIRLLPGVVTVAQLTGAPVLMGFMHRSADYRHQVLEISPPLQLEGQTAAAAFGRCVDEMSTAVRNSPAHWVYWASTADLVNIGLIRPGHPSLHGAEARRREQISGLAVSANGKLGDCLAYLLRSERRATLFQESGDVPPRPGGVGGDGGSAQVGRRRELRQNRGESDTERFAF
jgi:Kdo2-lipid IVA lauroyltransferase/acyltransferase